MGVSGATGEGRTQDGGVRGHRRREDISSPT
jgi:hypothetical protein